MNSDESLMKTLNLKQYFWTISYHYKDKYEVIIFKVFSFLLLHLRYFR